MNIFAETKKLAKPFILFIGGLGKQKFGVGNRVSLSLCRCGLVVVNPDHLVSGTAVVSALFCLRKAVLAEKFKGGGGRGSKVGIYR